MVFRVHLDLDSSVADRKYPAYTASLEVFG